MPKGTANEDDLGVQRRLQVVRYFVAGDNQTKFANELDIAVNRWNNFERGSPLSKEVAILLVRKVRGLTLDWLYLGIEDGLPVKLQRELATAESDLIAAEGRGSELSKKRTTKSRA